MQCAAGYAAGKGEGAGGCGGSVLLQRPCKFSISLGCFKHAFCLQCCSAVSLICLSRPLWQCVCVAEFARQSVWQCVCALCVRARLHAWDAFSCLWLLQPAQTYVYYLWWIMAWSYRFQNGLSLQQQQQQSDSVWHTHTHKHTLCLAVCVSLSLSALWHTLLNGRYKTSATTAATTNLPGDTSCQTCRLPLVPYVSPASSPLLPFPVSVYRLALLDSCALLLLLQLEIRSRYE